MQNRSKYVGEILGYYNHRDGVDTNACLKGRTRYNYITFFIFYHVCFSFYIYTPQSKRSLTPSVQIVSLTQILPFDIWSTFSLTLFSLTPSAAYFLRLPRCCTNELTTLTTYTWLVVLMLCTTSVCVCVCCSDMVRIFARVYTVSPAHSHHEPLT